MTLTLCYGLQSLYGVIYLKIGQISKQFNLTLRQLRHYEEQGLIKIKRDECSNYRIYDDSVKAKLEMIMLLKNLGFKLKEVKQILDFPKRESTQLLFAEKAHALSCEQAALSNRLEILTTVNRIIQSKGVEQLNIAEIIDDLLFVHNKNEGIVPMNNEKILFEFGVSLVEVVGTSNLEQFTEKVKEVRARLEAEQKSTLPTVRIRDFDELSPYMLRILFDGETVFTKDYTGYTLTDTKDDMLCKLEEHLVAYKPLWGLSDKEKIEVYYEKQSSFVFAARPTFAYVHDLSDSV